MKKKMKSDTREQWNIVHLRTALRGVVVSCLTVRTPVMDDGRWSSVGGPSSWSVVGITRRSVVLAPISIHGEAMFDRRQSFKLPVGESVSTCSPSKTVMLPAHVECLNRLLAALPTARALMVES